MQETQEMWVQSPGGENGNPLQYSCLGNPMDRGWWTKVCEVTESDMTEHTCTQENLGQVLCSGGITVIFTGSYVFFLCEP